MRNAAAKAHLPVEAPDLEAHFRLHAPRVLAAAYRITGNASDAEDVLQNVFLRLMRRRRGKQLENDLGPYLRRAAVNAGLDVVRARKARPGHSMDEMEPVADPSPVSPESAQSSRELRDRIRAALADESPKAAEMFALRYFEGYDNKEIARMVGASANTVGVTLHRTRLRVREAIAAHMRPSAADQGETT